MYSTGTESLELKPVSDTDSTDQTPTGRQPTGVDRQHRGRSYTLATLCSTDIGLTNEGRHKQAGYKR